MEEDAARRYRTLSEKAVNPGLKSVMMLLAEEEARHCEHYKSLAEGGGTKLDDSRLISAVTEVFLTMKERGDTAGTGLSEVVLYKEALEAEKSTMSFTERKLIGRGQTRSGRCFSRYPKKRGSMPWCLKM